MYLWHVPSTGISLRFEAVPRQESVATVSIYFIRRPVTRDFGAHSSISTFQKSTADVVSRGMDKVDYVNGES